MEWILYLNAVTLNLSKKIHIQILLEVAKSISYNFATSTIPHESCSIHPPCVYQGRN